jgi:serine/threonine protein phosphatase PrpC
MGIVDAVKTFGLSGRDHRIRGVSSAPLSMTHVIVTARADDIGSRAEQQDRVEILTGPDNARLLRLVDSLGGHPGAALAAESFMEPARDFLPLDKTLSDGPAAYLKQLCLRAHETISSLEPIGAKGPHSTCVCLYIEGGMAAWAHVGDSRLYHFRNGKLLTRTRDDSLAERLVQSGELTKEEAAFHPSQSHLLASLGGLNQPDVHVDEAELKSGDGFVLCSDGVWANIRAREMAGGLLQDDLQGAAGLAVQRGGAK